MQGGVDPRQDLIGEEGHHLREFVLEGGECSQTKDEDSQRARRSDAS
ncbi:hypothetical protein [Mesorhizobium amorphae]|nr:hypothetical protein [Mesorhizobium amorphae]